MSLENRTIAQIEEIILNSWKARFNFTVPFLSKALASVLARVLAGVWQIQYKTASWIFLQLFVSTASFKDFTVFGKTINPLKAWGNLIGIGDPLPSTQTRLQIDITVNSAGENLPSGTQFRSALNSILYITDQSYILTAGVMTIEVLATVGGTIGNLDSGDSISLVNPLGIIEREAVVNSILNAGTDAETGSSYRARIEEKFKQRPQGGALVDYRIWAGTVEGVTNSFWYTGDTTTHVVGYIVADDSTYPNRIPDTNLLLAVGDAIDFETVEGVKYANRRPPGAIIDPLGDKSYTNIKAPILKAFDVDVIDLDVPNPAETKVSIFNALTEYFQNKEPYIEGLSFPPVKNTIQQAEVIGIIFNIVQANDGTILDALVKFEGVSIPNYVLVEGEITQLDQLTYNGV